MRESQFKFWRVPELLNGLVEVLDMDSILEVIIEVALEVVLEGKIIEADKEVDE